MDQGASEGNLFQQVGQRRAFDVQARKEGLKAPEGLSLTKERERRGRGKEDPGTHENLSLRRREEEDLWAPEVPS